VEEPSLDPSSRGIYQNRAADLRETQGRSTPKLPPRTNFEYASSEDLGTRIL